MEQIKYSYDGPKELLGNFHQILISNYCKHNCFSNQGGCPANQNEEMLNLGKIYSQVESILKNKGSSKIALIAPSFFQLPNAHSVLDSLRNFKNLNPYFRIEDTVKHFVGKDKNYFEKLRENNVSEIWTGVETANKILRDSYGKPQFGNNELKKITKRMKDADIRHGWYLVLSSDDSNESIKETKSLIEKLEPYQTWLTIATRYNQDVVDLQDLRKSIDKMILFQEDLEKTMNSVCEGNKK